MFWHFYWGDLTTLHALLGHSTFVPVDNQVVWGQLHTKFLDDEPVKASETLWWCHPSPLCTSFMPIRTSHGLSGDFFPALLGYWSQDVPWCISLTLLVIWISLMYIYWYWCRIGTWSSCLAFGPLPLSPFTSHPIYIVRSQGYWVGWVIGVGLPLGTFSRPSSIHNHWPFHHIVFFHPLTLSCICLWPNDLHMEPFRTSVCKHHVSHYPLLT